MHEDVKLIAAGAIYAALYTKAATTFAEVPPNMDGKAALRKMLAVHAMEAVNLLSAELTPKVVPGPTLYDDPGPKDEAPLPKVGPPPSQSPPLLQGGLGTHGRSEKD